MAAMNYLKQSKVGLLLGLLSYAVSVSALEVDREVMPRITLGGKMISTLDVNQGLGEPDRISLEDSTVLFRLDKRLYQRGVAGAVMGIEEEDNVTRFQQMHGFYWDQALKLEIGRTRLRNTLLEFPILRDEDLLAYTHAANASSNEKFDQIYGELISADWYFSGKLQHLGAWFGGRRDGQGGVQTVDGLDSSGLSYVYAQAEALRYVRYLRHAGIRIDNQEVRTTSGYQWMRSLIAGVDVNLGINPERNWSLTTQMIVNQGVNDSIDMTVVSGQARMASTAVVSSLRYTARPYLLTRWQAAVTLAWKGYENASKSTQWSLAPSLFWHVGQGIDMVAQVIHSEYDAGLGLTDNSMVYQLGLAFSLESVFGDTIGERDSILNLEHGYIQ